jgi:SPP1 family predicted phage head-tail adaptor
VVERPRASRGADGELKPSFRRLFETWASIAPITGREAIAGQQVQALVDTRIVIRYREDTGIDETCRIREVTKGGIYDVVSVLPDPTLRRWVTFLCLLRTAEGWRRGD